MKKTKLFKGFGKTSKAKAELFVHGKIKEGFQVSMTIERSGKGGTGATYDGYLVSWDKK
jgi:hypothetical protein